ncbi:MAG: AAA family ATPase [Acidobacteriota bacterium]|nr:MAG: AAA family ATPase [Acidobacteriota bacterium]
MTAQSYTIKPRPNKRQHQNTPLGALFNKYDISLSRVEHWLASRGASVSSRKTVSKLIRHELSAEYSAELNPLIADAMREYMLSLDVSHSEIDAELSAVFTEGEYKPMSTKRIELTDAELDWFGLKHDPFAEFPRHADEVFISPELQRIIDRVKDAIKYPAFISVTGDIGSGKTVIRAMIEDYCATQPNVKVIWPEFFDMGRISPIQIAHAILRHFEVARIPRSTEAVGDLVKRTLERQFQSGNRVTLAFDECHRMSDAALSSLKNFFEMGSGGFQRWLSVMLFGQRVFDARLEDQKFRELNERIIPNPMPDFQAYSADYMRFRLKRANAPDDLFDADAVKLISGHATTPLQLGNIANKALRLTRDDFAEKQVVGQAIKEKMFFENRTASPFAKRRGA